MSKAFKTVHILGGGTIFHIRNHLALAAPAYGTTARKIAELLTNNESSLKVNLHLTKMADPFSKIETNDDIKELVRKIVSDLDTKIVFFNVAMCDYNATIRDDETVTGKYSSRLTTSKDKSVVLDLSPAEKIVTSIRKTRKDIFLVAFKTTCGATPEVQYLAGLDLCKRASANLVLANDTLTRLNMIITPEEAKYHVTRDRDDVIKNLVEMSLLRSQLTFTRSTVVDGYPVNWNSPEVPSSLRTVVNYCINKNAYKPFNGSTVGHFACKISENEFLTSMRRTNFNNLEKTGLVRIKTDGPDSVIAYGSKPSVGGQSQRIVFHDHSEYDCIVHFHCPLKDKHRDDIPIASQREYECGSHQCGENTSKNLKKFNNLSCVMLDQHGPNIVFHNSINPQEVIDFIEANFDLSDKTGGYVHLDNLAENDVLNGNLKRYESLHDFKQELESKD